MNKQYEFIEHTADAKFVAYGNDICDAFENAALAMFEVMLDTACVQPLQSYDIVLSADGLDGLLHDWLSELLFLFEVEGIAFSDFDVQSIKPVSYTHLRAHETRHDLVCRLLLEK